MGGYLGTFGRGSRISFRRTVTSASASAIRVPHGFARPKRPAPGARASDPERGRIVDTRVVVADLEKLAKAHGGAERELRTAMAQRLKAALLAGRAKAEQLLLKDRHGRRCAERLCRMLDEIIRILFEFVRQHLYPSAKSIRGRAHGDSRHRRLRPRFAGTRLRYRSPVRAALQTDRLGRAGRGSDPLLSVGYRAEGRPCDPLGQRMHPAGAKPT